MHDATITLFNFHERTGNWYPTIFNQVSLTEAKADSATADAGIKNGDTIEAIIRTAADKSNTEYGVKVQYVGPKAYAALENPVGYFTFATEQDFFFVGNAASGIVSDDDYDEGFYHAMNKEHDGVYLVQSAAFYSLIPHFEIGGR